MSSATNPNILAIVIDCEELVISVSSHLWSSISNHANLIFATSESAASSLLANTPVQAIILADSAIAKKHPKLRKSVFEYVQMHGGTAVFCSVFSSMISPPAMTSFFKDTWNMPWQFGEYYRTDFFLSCSATNLCLKPGLPKSYSMKTVTLKGVAEESRIYVPTVASWTQSNVFPSKPVDDFTQTAVAFEKVGDGWLGYVGDVNSEVETTAVVKAMCGLMKDDCCFNCGNDEMLDSESPVKMKRCSRCQKALYCSAECQRSDWKRHKVVCAAKAVKDV